MLKNNLNLILIAFCCLILSCKDFIEPSISDRQVKPFAPARNYQSTSYTMNFWWDEVEDAISYRLQIVTPKFDSVGALVIDTLVKGNKVAVNLSPGNYEWHLRAENGSSKTAYSQPLAFTVLFSSLKQQKVQTGNPANNLLTSESNLPFSWGELYGATQYRLQVDTSSFTDESKLLVNQLTPALQLNYVIPKDQNYQWRVRAENDTAQSQWSSIKTFTYDHTPPAAATLSAPTTDQSINLPVTLQWTAPATAVKYRLYLYRGDTNTAFSNGFPMLLNTTSYTLNQGNFGERLYWKVTAIDAAGNESTASATRSFTLQ